MGQTDVPRFLHAPLNRKQKLVIVPSVPILLPKSGLSGPPTVIPNLPESLQGPAPSTRFACSGQTLPTLLCGRAGLYGLSLREVICFSIWITSESFPAPVR